MQKCVESMVMVNDSMMLLELQERFRSALTSANPDVPDSVVDWISRDGIPPQQRLGIYRNNYRLSLRDVMQSAFPMLHRMLGCSSFNHVVGVFILDHPPRRAELLSYGCDFPDFLRHYNKTAPYPWMAELAQLEWLIQESFYAADARSLGKDDLIHLDQSRIETTVFEMHPSLRLMQSTASVYDLWYQLKHRPDDQNFEMDERAQHILMIRQNDDVIVESLNQGEYEFIRCLAENHGVGPAVLAAEKNNDDFDLQSCIVKCVKLGCWIKVIQ